MDSGERRYGKKKTSLRKFDLSFCLRDCGVTICPFGIRIKRTSPDCYPSAVFAIMAPESITPLERLAPYLLLISFSSIQFNTLIILLLYAKVNRFFDFIFVFVKIYYKRKGYKA